MADWPKLHSPEDADATHRWARECLEMWEAERKVLRAAAHRAVAALDEAARIVRGEFSGDPWQPWQEIEQARDSLKAALAQHDD